MLRTCMTIIILSLWILSPSTPKAKAATSMWENCANISHTTYYVPSSGGDLEALGCAFPTSFTSIYFTNVATTAMDATTSMLISRGRIAANYGAGISIVCPAAPVSRQLGPFQITMSDMYFGKDSAFRFIGTLPPNSSLLISNNTFTLTIQSLFSVIVQDPVKNAAVVSGIYIGVDSDAFNLESNSSIIVANNTAAGRSVASNTIVSVVTIWGQSALISNHSTLSVQGNVLINSAFTDGYVYTVYLYLFKATSATTLVLTDRSSIAVARNAILNCTFRSALATVANIFLSGRSITALSIGGQSAFAVSGNSFSNSSTLTSMNVALLGIGNSVSSLEGSLAIDGRSVLSISNNIVSGSSVYKANVAYLLLGNCSKSVLLLGASTISLDGNSITNTTASNTVYVAYIAQVNTGGSPMPSLALKNSSVITMQYNSIGNSAVALTSLVAIEIVSFSGYLPSAIVLSDQAGIILSDNSATNCILSSSAVVMTLSVIGSYQRGVLSLDAQSFLILEGNSIVNSSIGSSCNLRAADFNFESNVLEGSFVLLAGLSTIAVSNNAFVGNSGSPSSASIVRMNIKNRGKLLIRDGSTFTVMDNSHEFAKVPTAQVSVDNFTLVGERSAFLISNNSNTYTGGVTTAPNVFLAMNTSTTTDPDGVLNIGPGAQLTVARNVLRYNSTNVIQLLSTSLTVVIHSEGTLAVTGNILSCTPKILVNLSAGLKLGGLLKVEHNTIFASGPIYDFLLVKANMQFIRESAAVFRMCANNLSWFAIPPRSVANFVLPSSLASMLASCFTVTASGSHSSSRSLNNSLTRSLNSPLARSLNSSLTPSFISDVTNRTPNSSTFSNKTPQSVSHEHPHSASVSQTSITKHLVPPAKPLVPVLAVVEAAKGVRDVTSVFVVVTAVASVTGGQMGVANAMLRLSECTDSSDDSLPILVHPLRFSFGDRKYEKNVAAALSNTLIVPLIATIIALGPVRLLIMWARLVSSRVATAQMGWPSLLILPFSNLAEGIGTTVVAAIMSGEPFGVGIGLVSTSLVLAFAGSWVWTLASVIPLSRLTLQPEEDGKRRNFVMRIVRPTHRWVPLRYSESISNGPRPLGRHFLERYSNAIGDKQWYYAEVVSFGCSLAVGVTEGLPTSLCRERVLIALVPALLQCGLAVLSLIPLERFLQSLLALCLVPMYVVVAAKVYNDSSVDEGFDTALAVLSSAGNVIGIANMSLGLVTGLWEIAITHNYIRIGRIGGQTADESSTGTLATCGMPMLNNEDFEDYQEQSPAATRSSLDSDGHQSVAENISELSQEPESEVVRRIIAQLRDFEAEQQLL